MSAFLVVPSEINCLGRARRLETDSLFRIVRLLAVLRVALGPNIVSYTLGLVIRF